MTHVTGMTVSVDPVYPQVHVQLSGEDGNGFLIACRVRTAIQRQLRKERLTDDMEPVQRAKVIKGVNGLGDMFFEEALSGDYQHLLATCIKWVTVY